MFVSLLLYVIVTYDICCRYRQTWEEVCPAEELWPPHGSNESTLSCELQIVGIWHVCWMNEWPQLYQRRYFPSMQVNKAWASSSRLNFHRENSGMFSPKVKVQSNSTSQIYRILVTFFCKPCSLWFLLLKHGQPSLTYRNGTDCPPRVLKTKRKDF